MNTHHITFPHHCCIVLYSENSIRIELKRGSVPGNLKIIWRPEPDVIATVISMNNVKVRLTTERWLHIAEYHRELEDFQLEILLAIAQPDKLYHSPAGTEPNFAAVKVFDRLGDFGLPKNLTVHYKEPCGSTGFILTAFVISDKKLSKRFKEWQRLK
jgi:hypothetical protein